MSLVHNICEPSPKALQKIPLCKRYLEAILENGWDMGLRFKLMLVGSSFLREPPILVLSH
jgi:hypothetical protein